MNSAIIGDSPIMLILANHLKKKKILQFILIKIILVVHGHM